MPLNCRIDIEGIPAAAAGLRRGLVYAVVAHDESHALALAWGSLLGAAGQDLPAWYVADGEPRQALSAASVLAQQARQAIAAGSLCMLHSAAAGAAGFSGDLSAQLRDELAHFGIPDKSLVVIDGADRYLKFAASAADNAAVIRRWRDWAERHEQTLLLLFRRRTAQAGDPAAELISLAPLFGGIARQRFADGAATWEIFHWFSAAGACFGKSLQLRLRPDGGLTASEHDAARVPPEPAADEDAVFALKGALAANQAAPSNWFLLDDVETLMNRVADAVAATVILCFDRAIALPQLTQLVFALRQARGNRLKIIVREMDARLRHNQESLLLRLGANLVAPAEINHSRFLGLTAMLQGQLFARALPASYEAAVADAMPAQEQGYLPPQRFAEAVAATLERSRALGVQNALIRLPLAYGLAPVDPLRYFTARRNGDLCCADDGSVYVFLFACRESDVDLALDRLFRLPVAELFRGDDRALSMQTIQTAIQEFAARAAALPDLSTELDALGARSTPAEAAPEKRGAVVRRDAAPAVRRPLKLRPQPLLSAVTVTTS